MSENMIQTYADQMLNDTRNAIEWAHLPGGAQELERDLLAATAADAGDIAALARLVSLAHAAFIVADAGIDGIAAPWYREIGQRLLRRSMEAMTVIEADREPRPAAGLN